MLPLISLLSAKFSPAANGSSPKAATTSTWPAIVTSPGPAPWHPRRTRGSVQMPGLSSDKSITKNQALKTLMKLFGLNITRSSPPTVEKSLSPAALAWLGGDPEPASPVLSDAYQQVAWVYRAINIIAEQIANIPFLFSRGQRGKETLITSGPLLDFYARPHPSMNQFQYWELRILWLMLRGECFRIPQFGEDRSPLSHKPVLQSILMPDPALFSPILQGHQLQGWRYSNRANRSPLQSQVFLPEEVWFEKLPNPLDFWRGLPPLYVASLAAKTDFAASAFMNGLMENNADNGLIVRTADHLDDAQRQQLLAALRDRKRRAGPPDRPLLLWSSAEIVRPQLSSADLQFLENRKFSRSEICAAFGVPEEIVTTTDKAKYDVMAGARLNFIENRVAPLCARLEAEEQATVKAIDPNAVGWFDADSLPIMQEARRSRLVAARTGFEMGIPLNELNRVFDLGFKSFPWGDAGYLKSNLTPAGTTMDEHNHK